MQGNAITFITSDEC